MADRLDGITFAIVLVVVALGVIGFLLTRSHRSGVPESAAPKANLGGALRRIWGNAIDDETWVRLEEQLLAADVGVEPSSRIVGAVRKRAPVTENEAREALGLGMLAELSGKERDMLLRGAPSVVMVVGVNGSGKTTTVAKLAHIFQGQGWRVSLAAADTFRAAAGEQLMTWEERLGATVVVGAEGADPASVAHDAISRARTSGTEVVLVDTAGRLHSRGDLMGELAKIHRVAGGPSGVDEVLLVLDASGGQNGLAQVREFAAAVPLSGLVLTKMDGTAKGGIALAAEAQTGIPVKFVGTGEGLDDLRPFDPDEFVASLLGE